MPSDDLSPADAFGLLADANRFAIVEALVDHAFDSTGDAISFADLRRAAGVDDAGKFNYHLDRLRPQFVEKRDDGYAPRFAALEAVGAARAGTFTELPDERRAELDTPCPSCGDPLTGVHEGSHVRVRCESEDQMLFQSVVPPLTARERDVPDVVTYAVRDTQRQVEKLLDGVCMVCGGPVDSRVSDDEDARHVVARLDCTACAFQMRLPVAGTLVRHPAVVAHYHRHGRDVRNQSYFSAEFMSPEHTTVESEDPFAATVDVPVEGDTITLRVDENLNAEAV